MRHRTDNKKILAKILGSRDNSLSRSNILHLVQILSTLMEQVFICMGTRIKHYLSKSIDKFIAMSQIKKSPFIFLIFEQVSITFGPLNFPLLQNRRSGDRTIQTKKNSPLIFLIFESSPAGGCVGPLKSVACFHNIGSRTHKITFKSNGTN